MVHIRSYVAIHSVMSIPVSWKKNYVSMYVIFIFKYNSTVTWLTTEATKAK